VTLFPLPREPEPVTALAPHPSPLPRERELVTMDRPLVYCSGSLASLAGVKKPALVS